MPSTFPTVQDNTTQPERDLGTCRTQEVTKTAFKSLGKGQVTENTMSGQVMLGYIFREKTGPYFPRNIQVDKQSHYEKLK